MPWHDGTDRISENLAGRSMRSGPAAAVAAAAAMLDDAPADDLPLRLLLMVEMGSYQQLAGDLAAAERTLRAAIELDERDPGPLAALAALLLDVGRAGEAAGVLRDVRRLRPRDPDVYVVVGEALEAAGDTAGALRWFTAGAELAMREDEAGLDALLLLRGRRRVRAAQGFPADDLDELVEAPDGEL